MHIWDKYQNLVCWPKYWKFQVQAACSNNSFLIYMYNLVLHFSNSETFNLYEQVHNKSNKMIINPMMIQCTRQVWSVFTVCIKQSLGISFIEFKEQTDLTGLILRVIWVFAWCTCHFVCFVMHFVSSKLQQSFISVQASRI